MGYIAQDPKVEDLLYAAVHSKSHEATPWHPPWPTDAHRLVSKMMSVEIGSLEVILGWAAPFVGMIHKFQKKKQPLHIFCLKRKLGCALLQV